jgi:hypothetical protein
MSESGVHSNNPVTKVFQANTGMGAMGSFLPFTSAGRLKATIDPIKANLAFDKLQEIRQNSPTGGAVGNVSDNDMKLLASVAGSLDPGQGEDRLDRTLRDVRKRYVDLLMTWGYSPQEINEATASWDQQPAAAPRPGAPPQAAAPGRGGAPARKLPPLVIRH